jgi:prevent-host-death family protein
MRVSIVEFKSHFAKYIRQVQTGEAIEVTSHRKVVARLHGVALPDGTTTSRLVAARVATWQGGKPMGASLRLLESHIGSAAISALVLEDRN